MRIGITLQSLDETWGGIGVYTAEVVRHLLRVDAEDEYVLIYPGFGAARKFRGRFRRHRNALEIETEWSRVPHGPYWDQVVVPGVARRYGVDVLFNPFLSVPFRGRFQKVMIMHAVEFHTVPKAYDLPTYCRWLFMEKVLLPAADRLISISHTMTDDIRRLVKYPSERVRTIYHGVSDRFMVLDDAALLSAAREEYALPERFILFVGHLYPQKNFAVLARAFARIRDRIPHRLVIAGRTRWKVRADLDLIAELGIGDRVDFLQYVPHDDLARIYNLADCFVYPSLYEAFGLAQVEAMACGCPVVAARAGAIPEIAGDAALLFDPHDVEGLATAILGVLEDRRLRDGLVAKGLEQARRFRWDRCARQTLEVFRELA